MLYGNSIRNILLKICRLMEFDITQREYRDEPGDRGSMTNYYAGSDSQGQLFKEDRKQGSKSMFKG